MENLTAERVDVWAASIKDEPGSLAQILAVLRDVGADLDFILVRRAPEKPGTGVVFLTPLRGDKEISAAADLGFNVTNSVHSVRIEGENNPGIAAAITEKLATAGINLRGFSAAVTGTQYIMYIGLDSESDAQKAIHTIREK
ncbi:MAG: ACT domain-containing protein [Candidatus Latescibacterota bacterium]